jgi:hypothetical protein
VRIAFDPSDAPLAAQTGVTVEGIQVLLDRQGSAAAPQVAITDATGLARFEALLEGTYTVSADRPLTQVERAALPDGDRDVSVFAGARRLAVVPPTPSATVELVASRRGSLVVSEGFFSTSAGTGGFGNAQYIEFFNASDTAIYLDGKLYFQTALNLHRMVLDQYDCSGWVSATARVGGATLISMLRFHSASPQVVDEARLQPSGDRNGWSVMLGVRP